MRRIRFSLAIAVIVFASLIATVRYATAYSTSTAIFTPPAYTTFQPPAAGNSYLDPVFGTAIKRISDAMHTVDVGRGGMVTLISQEYSSMSPFNMGNTRLLLQHFSYFSLYDGAGNFIEDLYQYGIRADTEPRWSRLDPNEFYYVDGNVFKKFNVGTNTSTVIHTFSEYSKISGMGESDICFDGKHFVFAGDSRYVFVYSIPTDTNFAVFDAGAPGLFDQLYITPDDNIIIGWYAGGSNRFNGVELYDINMNFQRQLAHALGHMDVTRDTTGEEVLLWANGGDPSLQVRCDAGVTKIRLSDANQTCVWTGSWSLAIHVSAADRNGWFFVDTYNPIDIIPPTGWATYTNEILQIKMDGSEVRRLVHHRSRPFNSYTYQPKASISRDGAKLVYTSNYGLQAQLGYPAEYADTYLIDLPTGTSTEGGSDTKGGPAPSPGAAGTSTSRVEENDPTVTYNGAWYTNTNSVHSGGAANGSMDSSGGATLTFTGIGVSIVLYTDEWSGIATVAVDGESPSDVDAYSTPGKAQVKAYTVTGLSNTTHTITIAPSGRKNVGSQGLWIWVDAFDVMPGPAVPPGLGSGPN